MNQRGAASLIIVTLTTIIISVLTVATTKLMTGEVRQAIDSESGIKAYYIAEGATEETIASIKAALVGGIDIDAIQQGCDTDGVFTNFASFGALPDGISCRKVTTTTNGIVNQPIAENQVKHFDLSRNYFDRIELGWDTDPVPSGDQRIFNNNNLPAYVSNSPPFMELTRIVYADSDSGPSTVVDPASIQVKSIILVPTSGEHQAWVPADNNGCGTIADRTINFDACHGSQGGSVKVGCIKPTDMRCGLTVSNFIPAIGAGEDQKRVVLRLRPYYQNALFDMKLFQNTNPIDFRLDAIEIDITAYIGGSYRRVKEEFDVTADPGPIDVLFGDEYICKAIQIKSISPTGEGPNDEVRDDPPCDQIDYD